MSSIRQQEPMKPAPKSPIPRSRSDFSYVGLTPKEKRWTTDFSLLLPPFPRDTSGYSRLAESPVTHQPKPRNTFTKSPTLNRNHDQSSSGHNPACEGVEPRANKLSKSHTLDQDQMYSTKRVPACDGIEPKAMGRSRTLEPINFNETKRTKAVRQSPTLEPYDPKCNSTSTKKLYPTTELGPISGFLAITRIRNPLTNPLATHSNHSTSEGRCLKTIDVNRPLLQSVSHSNANQSTPEANLHKTKHSTNATGRCLMTSPPAPEANKPQPGESRDLNSYQSPTQETRSCLKTNLSTSESNRPSLEVHRNLKLNQSPTQEASNFLKTNPSTSESNKLSLEAHRNLNSYQSPESNSFSKTNPSTSKSNKLSLEALCNLNSCQSPELNSFLKTKSSALESNRPSLEASCNLNPPAAKYFLMTPSSTSRPSPEPNRHLHQSPTPEAAAGRYLMAVPRHLTPEAGRHLMSIRKSPTMDSRTLRYSPLLSQHIISRSPTLDPGVLSSRSPRCSHGGVGRSPFSSRVGAGASEVVRSQSLRSLRKGMDRSPAKIRNSESAQSDVTCPIHRAFPLVEADEYDTDDFRRLRNFSVTNKGLINWGDSFRSQSFTSVPDRAPSCSSSQWDVASTKSYPMTSSNSQWTCSNRTPQRYRVAILGADEVGKTSLIRQFQTSEYICAFDTSYDINKEYAITVILNKEESELEFIEHRLSDEGEERESGKSSDACIVPYADAHVVVYSVTNRRSFSRAIDILVRVQKTFRRSAVLLVGNKSDLVRVRAITTDEGQTAAKEQSSPFIETSAAINHQVDELLVAILTHIRSRSRATAGTSAASRWRAPHHYSLSRARGLIKKFLKKACFQSKSSDNLQRL